MEINLISFLPIISHKWTSKKMVLLYFIIQRTGSLVILIGGLFSNVRTLISLWIPFGLLLKTSLAPFQFWGRGFICSLNTTNSFLFLTWQKLAPLFLLFASTSKNFLTFVILINLFASIARIGSKLTVLLLFFTSLRHMSWLLAATHTSACKYFILYSIITIPLFTHGTFNLAIMMMNISGLPPMTGFFMKLMVLQNCGGLGWLLVGISIVHLYAYMRLFVKGTDWGSLKPVTITTCRLGVMLLT